MVLLIKSRLLGPALAALLATGCASTPALDTAGVTSRATPAQVVEAPGEYRGERVQWGGQIVSILNKGETTVIEVLSYPLARDGLPNTYRKPTGRFVLQYGGFLEPIDYAPGRLVTAVGDVGKLITTSVGETRFLVPRIDARQLKLWPDTYGGRNRSNFGFGFGISIGL